MTAQSLHSRGVFEMPDTLVMPSDIITDLGLPQSNEVGTIIPFRLGGQRSELTCPRSHSQ